MGIIQDFRRPIFSEPYLSTRGAHKALNSHGAAKALTNPITVSDTFWVRRYIGSAVA